MAQCFLLSILSSLESTGVLKILFFSILGLLVKDQGKCQWREELPEELGVCVRVCVHSQCYVENDL